MTLTRVGTEVWAGTTRGDMIIIDYEVRCSLLIMACVSLFYLKNYIVEPNTRDNIVTQQYLSAKRPQNVINGS